MSRPSTPAHLLALTRRHLPVLIVLALGALLRLGTEVAYGPALLFYDSKVYLAQANHSLFENPAQPAGYPLLIRLFQLGGSLGPLTVAQHLAGLATGLLVYVVIVTLTDRRWLAAAGCAVVVLDGYAIAVEQYVMTDAFFTTMVLGSAALLLLGRRRETTVASLLILALATMVRTVSVFCVPVWLAYAAWRHRWSWTTLACVLASLLPLAGYAAINDARTGHFALTDDTAWLLYGRVEAFGQCAGLTLPQEERILCPRPSQMHHGNSWSLYNPDSPAVQAFGLPAISAPPRVNRILEGYALRVMEARPLQYAAAVGKSLGDAFVPGAPSDDISEIWVLKLPTPGPWIWPSYHPRQRWPAAAMRSYAAVIHTCRALLGVFVAMALGALLLTGRSGQATPRLGTQGPVRPAIALMLSGGLALLLGAALSHFELRYVLPAIPLLTCAGLLGLSQLATERLWISSRHAPPRHD